MPRKSRFNLIGVPRHIIQRGINREHFFFFCSKMDSYLSYYEKYK